MHALLIVETLKRFLDEIYNFMGLKAYYDSSGKNDTVNKVLTLAGFAAPEDVWHRFETEWKCALDDYGAQFFHMSEAMSLKGHFNGNNGWNEAKVYALVKDLFKVIGKYRTEYFEAYSCSVILSDYRRAQLTIPKLRSPEAICVNFCIGGLQLSPADFDSPKPIDLFFDRKETFLKTIYAVWDQAKNKTQTKGWPKQIGDIKSVDSKTTFPVQAADMFAWIVHRHHTGPNNHPWYHASFLLAEHYSKIYNYEKIVAEYANS